jgi:alpha-D-ribose 1-methylphosphonate 5-triphosphate synthase subunit PhnL
VFQEPEKAETATVNRINPRSQQTMNDKQTDWLVRIRHLHKQFHLHTQENTRIEVLSDFDIDLYPGECVVLSGPSGAGKSTILKLLYGNYKCLEGAIHVRHNGHTIDMARACPRHVLAVRRDTIGYVSQFLRVIPRVSTLDVVAEPLRNRGVPEPEAHQQAADLLRYLAIPDRLWSLSPTTFSGGEQQRVNIARVFVADYPILILDEPTASLDEANRNRVRSLIRRSCENGSAVIGIFHDPADRSAVATRQVSIEQPSTR